MRKTNITSYMTVNLHRLMFQKCKVGNFFFLKESNTIQQGHITFIKQ